MGKMDTFYSVICYTLSKCGLYSRAGNIANWELRPAGNTRGRAIFKGGQCYRFYGILKCLLTLNVFSVSLMLIVEFRSKFILSYCLRRKPKMINNPIMEQYEMNSKPISLYSPICLLLWFLFFRFWLVIILYLTNQ